MATRTIRANVFSDVTLADTNAAYIAGFVDGEGTFTIVRQRKPQTRTGFQYRGVFSIANTNLGVLEAIRTMCRNGCIARKEGRRVTEAGHRPLFHLRFTAEQTRCLLPQLQPYLIVKKRAAFILAEFLAMSTDWRWHQRTNEEWNRMEALRAEIRNLNARALSPVRRAGSIEVRSSLLGNNQHKKSKP